MLIFIKLCMKETLLSALKGNNSCKTHNFRTEVRNVQMVFCLFLRYPVYHSNICFAFDLVNNKCD